MKALSEQVRARAREIVGANETAPRLAAAWALGVAVGLSPVIGFHTAVALILAFALRLNKVDVLLGTLIVNPWSLPPYFAFSVMLGSWLTGWEVPRIVLPQLSTLLRPSFWNEQASWLAPLLTVWAVGSSLIAITGGVVTFFLVRSFIERRRRHRQRHGTDHAPPSSTSAGDDSRGRVRRK